MNWSNRSLWALIVALWMGFGIQLHADVNDGLVGYFPFEGDTLDLTTNENHGIDHGGLSYVAGLAGLCASFDGLDDYVEIGRIIDADFSVAFWIKTTVEAPGTIDWWSGLGRKRDRRTAGLRALAGDNAERQFTSPTARATNAYRAFPAG